MSSAVNSQPAPSPKATTLPSAADLDAVARDAEIAAATALQRLSIESVYASATNTRETFEGASWEAFVADVKQRGVLVPILARPHPDIVGQYQLIAGERRWRAARAAGFITIPARIVEMTDDEALDAQAVENLQRSDLSPIEEGRMYKAMLDRSAESMGPLKVGRKRLVELLAGRLHKDARTIYERLQILGLEPEVLAQVEKGAIGASAATVLASKSKDQQRSVAAKAASGEKVTVAKLKSKPAPVSLAKQPPNEAAVRRGCATGPALLRAIADRIEARPLPPVYGALQSAGSALRDLATIIGLDPFQILREAESRYLARIADVKKPYVPGFTAKPSPKPAAKTTPKKTVKKTAKKAAKAAGKKGARR